MMNQPSIPNLKNSLRQKAKRLSIAIAILGSIGLFGMAPSAEATDKVVLTYGLFGRSITLDELENFANTGRQTPTLEFLIKATKQNPEQIRQGLTHEVKISPKLLDDILYSLPGEYALFMAGKIFHTPARRSNDKALRSAIILSSLDDQRISILEFLQNYPTQEFYIDGYRLAKTAGQVSNTVSTVESKLKGPIAIITDLFNGVICDCETPAGPRSPINAN